MRTLLLSSLLLLPAVGWADPSAEDFCEYTVDGGPPNRGGGGVANVMSIHWMAPTQPGRSIATPLLINCGPAGAQLNFDTVGNSKAEDVPMKPATLKIEKKPKKGNLGVRKAGFFTAEGSVTLTAWDTRHVAGTFSFTASDGKKYAGKFSLKCPYPGNGVCG